MKKLFTFLSMLILCIGSMWATDVVISDQTNLNTITPSNFSTTAVHKYGTYSAPAGGTTFTTNSTSGLSGVTVTSTSNIVKSFYYDVASYRYGLAFRPTDGETYTITIAAPEGYVIIGYTMKAISTSQNQKFEVVASSGTYTVSSSQNYITGRVDNQQSTTFTLRNKLDDGKAASQQLCLPFFTITVLPADASSLKATNVSDLSNSKTYLIHSKDFSPSDLSRGYLSATSGYLACTSKTGNWAPSSFAFVQYDGKYFLYDVTNKKFARTENYSSNSGEVKGIETNTSILPVTFEKVSNGIFKIKMGDNYMNFSGSYTYGITINYYSTSDAGNNLELIENGSFDDTEAIATLEAYLANPTIVNGGKYKIKLNGTSYYVSKDASGNAKTEETASELIISENGTNAAGKKAYSIKDAGTNKYLSYTKITYSGGQNSRLSWSDDATNSKFVFTQGSGDYSSNVLIRPADACDNNYVTSWNQTKTDQVFVFWILSNTMSYWTLEKVTKTVTYNLKWNGNTIQTNSSVTAHVGGAAADFIPWNAPAYCSLTSDVETIESTTTEVNVTLNWDGPFDFSTDFASAKWYYLTLNNKWAAYSTSTPYPLTAELQKNDNSLWAFIGNPIDGIQVINKGAGDGLYLLSDDPSIMVNSSHTYYSSSFYEIGQNSNGFTLVNDGYYFYDVNNGISWGIKAAYSMNATFTVRSYYCQQALDDLATYASNNAVGQYFGVRQESIDLIQGLFEGKPKMTATEYTTTYSVPDGVRPYINIKYPATGYYRIKNNGTGNYLAYGTPTVSGGGNRPAGLIATSNSTDAASVIHLTGSKGTYKISVQGLNIQSQTNANVAFPGSTDTGVDFVFNISSPGIVSITNAASRVSDNQDGSLHEGSDGWGVHGVVNWDASAANSKWVVEDATSFSGTLTNANDNTGTGHSYATLCVPFAISSITGASAYAPTKDGNYLVMGNALESTIAGTPVMLVGDTDAGSYTANINTNTAPVSSPIDTDTYALKGTFTGTSIDCTATTGTNYVLGFDRDNDNRIGFYHVNNASYNLKANRAYLNTSKTNARGFYLKFDDDVTGIVAPIGETEEGTTIYNLSGQRLNKMQKGINIVNGKKVLF